MISALLAPATRPRMRPFSGSTAWLIAIVVLMTAASPVLSEYGLQVGLRLLIAIVLAEAWNLLAGYAGLVSLGSAAFVGTGGYVLMGLLNKAGIPLAPALILCGASAALLALVVSPALFRMRGLYFTVGTLALGEALRLLMVNVPIFGGATGLFLDGDPLPTQALYIYGCGMLAFTLLVVAGATGTRLSVAMKAIRDDEDAAAQFGVRPFRIKLMAFMTASFLMGMAGGLQGYKLGAIEPYGMFGLAWSVGTLSIVIIGGLGTRLGPVVGSVFVIMLAEGLADYPELHIALTGLVLIVVIRFAPKGLCGLAASVIGRHRRPAAAEGDRT